MMRRMMCAIAAAATLMTGGALVATEAQAMPATAPGALRSVADQLSVSEQAQYYYGGRRYCWYRGGWRGPGWYWCGYSGRRGYGWGGGYGWRGWHYGRPAPRVYGPPRHRPYY
jgi:hypothetical protein